MAPKKSTVTLSEVAAAARVSKATASNVFSRPERVRPALRERVEAAAKALDYAGPDPRGQVLSSGRVNAIGIVPTCSFGISIFLTDIYARLFLSGVTEVCEAHSVGVSLVSGRDDQQAWGIRTALVDGFILDNADQAAFIPPMRKHIPVVVVNARGGPEVSSVRIADREGARLATEHLLGLGHRRIVVASVLRESRAPVFHEPGKARSLVAPITAMIERLAGVGDALSAAGLSLDTMPIAEACTVAEAEALGSGPAMILDRLGDATAVIALGDKLALAILAEARARGINVPRQLSVVGFDDFAPAAAAIPPLTTVNHDPVEAGRTAARLLLEGGPPQDVVMPVKLVVRASTAVRGPGAAPDRRSSR